MTFPAVTQTGVGTSNPVYTEGQAPTSIQCDVTGTVTYSVQTTLNDPGAQTWYPHPDPQTQGATGSIQTSTLAPIRAFRLVVSSGTGSVIMTIGA